jgi:hypothetical protein
MITPVEKSSRARVRNVHTFVSPMMVAGRRRPHRLLPPRARLRKRWNWTVFLSLVTATTAVAAVVTSVFTSSAQIRLSEQGQATDRFIKAVEEIDTGGSSHLDVRLGGIYALEMLAADSTDKQPAIVEVLAAFVHSNVPVASYELTPVPGPAGDKWIRIDSKCPGKRPTVDVQAALSVIGRRDPKYDGNPVDLSFACLGSANLMGAHLENANLRWSDLSNGRLDNAKLQRANLFEASLNGTLLLGADLRGVVARQATMRLANFTRANLTDSTFRFCYLESARFDGANLTDADFSRSVLRFSKHDHETVVIGTRKDHETEGAWW